MSYRELEEKEGERLRYNPMGKEPNLMEAAINFIHERCTDLRFDAEKEQYEIDNNKLLGTSAAAEQIKYNMQMDIDRLCLENALKRFLEYGSGRNAFDVYFCYIEMFIGKYAACRRMIEMLSEYESNGSSLLMKHRDHYSHSVYVFALGLAVYETNSSFRECYMRFYNLTDDKKAAHHFLKYWGLASLFHDIGYPFELPFEQVESYFDINKKKRSDCPYMMYGGLGSFTAISEQTNEQLKRIFESDKGFSDTNALFAFDISQKLGSTYRIDKTGLEVILKNKPTDPDCFGYFMDHAYFSANLLFKELSAITNGSEPYRFEKPTIDALTAILLHNSLYKFSIAFYKGSLNIPFKAELHPLAYLLMLCDELQCWNRTSYGRNSRTELHPMNCRFKFLDGRIEAQYIFDKSEAPKIEDFKNTYRTDRKAELKAFSKMYVSEDEQKSGKTCDFLADIERIVDTNMISIAVSYSLEEADRKHKSEYLSSCNFIHLYNFAVSLNARYSYEDMENHTKEEQEKLFDGLSLEYKLSNIGQAKAFDKYLNVLGCFYTDKDVGYEMVSEFTEADMETIGPLEHGRWIREHWAMGWGRGELMRKPEREQKRLHNLMIEQPAENTDEKDIEEMIKKHYDDLSKDEQGKDTAPMNHMLMLLKEFEGLRIYKLN